MLDAVRDAAAARAVSAAKQRKAGVAVIRRPARIHALREGSATLWYLDDGALALYRVAGGQREPEDRLESLPDAERPTSVFEGVHYP